MTASSVANAVGSAPPALCLLTLEVYYRHLPLTKRSTAGDPKLLEGAK